MPAAIAFALACGSERRPPGIGSPPDGAAANGSGGASSLPQAGGGEGGGATAGAAGAAGGVADGPSCVPRLECQRLCSALGDDPAGCGLGEPRPCGCACEERFAGPCPDALHALSECVGEAPSIDCRARGRIFPGCEDESFALEACDFAARGQLCAGDHPACTPFCRGLRSAFCAHGPESAAACLCGCEATLVTRCAPAFDAFMACAEGAPTFGCDADGRPVASACDADWRALAACLAAPASSSPDAG